MQSVSSQAFNIFHNELDMFTQYPVNTPVVVVDATNLSKIGRSKIIEIAEKNGYNIIGLLFDYSNMEDYFKYTDESTNKKEIKFQVQTMRKTTIKEIDRTKFHAIHKISSIDEFAEINFAFEQTNAGFKVDHDNVCVVGDLHGCYDELLTLLADDKGIAIEDDGTGIPVMRAIPAAVDSGKYVHHVLLGDIVDKGPSEGVEKLVRFICKNRDFFTIVEGNHDRWNYNYLKGKIKKSPDNDVLIASFFDSVTLFQNNEELKELFFGLYESMYTFAYNDKFIVTHAPCENKYLGKSDKKSLKAMNTYMYPKRASFTTEEEYLQAREDAFQFLIKDGEHNAPYHIFGHVMTKAIFWNKNKVGIDTGCVAGGMLASVIFMKENRKFYMKKYKSTQPVTQELIPLFRTRQNEIDYGALDIPLQKRLKYCAKNGVNYISGTMSPADKDADLFDIESLFKGVEYYRSNGIKQFMLQPKFMGSRCNLLLHATDLTKCKAFSRNAYEIKSERLHGNRTLDMLFTEMQIKFFNLFKDANLDYILFDGELLPWNAMGKDLIEREFMIAYKACNSEHDILRATGFETVLNELDTKVQSDTLLPHELNVKKSYENFKPDILHIDVMQRALDKYKRQLDLFGSDGELEFRPFAILKTVAIDGSEENWVSQNHTNLAMFNAISGSPYCFISEVEGAEKYVIVINPNGKCETYEAETADDAIMAFWTFVTEQNEMEGVVIKPNQAYVPNVAPYIKVRNKEYLRLTYGFDYDALKVKTERLIEKKSIKRKMETSIKEYELGRRLLDVKMTDISLDNKEWLSLACQLLSEQEGEKTLDPRL